MLKLEPLKTSLEDLVEGNEALETVLPGLPDATATYTEFFANLADKQIACVDKAIEAVSARVKQAPTNSQAQNADVKLRREKQVGRSIYASLSCSDARS